MFNFQDINAYVYYLTGYKDLIVPKPIKRFPANIEKRISQARRKKLKVYTYRDADILIFHEFCHFVESEEDQLLLPNFGLGLNSESRLRETRVRCIQNSFAQKIGDFAEKPRFSCSADFCTSYCIIFSMFSSYSSSDAPMFQQLHRNVLKNKSVFRNFEFLVDRLKYNVNYLKEMT